MVHKNMNADEIQWCPAIPGNLISSNAVHVWRVNLATIQSEELLGILSADEIARAGRLRFERDRKRFIIARGILRKILSCYIDRDPHKLCFEYTSHGKPILATHTGEDTFHFNVSHSAAFALYAITLGRKIGIDIERVRDDVAIEQIVQRFFSQDEISSLDRIHNSLRFEAFFQYWTRKEAFLKALGEGLSFPMEHCDVSLINGKVSLPITLLGDNRENSNWYGLDLFPGSGYAAAIAVEGADWDLSCWHYSV